MQGTEFLRDQCRDAKIITQRLIWCAVVIWKDMLDADIVEFKEVNKYIRSILHKKARSNFCSW